jgi:RsiW-degrading membrane proteinase PrsW (M82 family)
MPTFEELVETLKSWFIYSGTSGEYIFYGTILAIAFGAVWLFPHWPPLFKKHWLWIVAFTSAFLTLVALVFIQIPAQSWINQTLSETWDSATLNDWFLLVVLPMVLVSGLVQEGAKMVPMVFWWLKSGRNISPGMGLAIGAIAGAAFGIFEATWVHNQVIPYAGLPWEAINNGFSGISPYWERFFTVGFHIAVSALAGYGLAIGKGWQFFLLAAVLHTLLNYIAYLGLQYNLTVFQIEIYIAVVAVLVIAAALLLRWTKREEEIAD